MKDKLLSKLSQSWPWFRVTISNISVPKPLQTHYVNIFFITIGVLATLVFFLPYLKSVMALLTDQPRMLEVITNQPIMAPFITALFLAVSVVFGFIPSTPILALAGYLFGFLQAWLIGAGAITLTRLGLWFLVRRVGLQIARKFLRPSFLEKWNGLLGQRSGFFWFIVMSVPILPNDLMAVMAGMSPVSPRGFFAANLAAGFSISALGVAMGVYGLHIPPIAWGLALAMSAILSLNSKRIVSRLSGSSK